MIGRPCYLSAVLLTVGISLVSCVPGQAQNPETEQRVSGANPKNPKRSKASELPASVKVIRDLPYVADGHARQHLDLYLPEQSSGRLPVIVWVHGGGWSGGDKARSPAIPLAARGYAVASVNYRFSQHAIFPAQIHDCKAAIRWLRAHADEYGLDPQRFGAWGSSAGGHLVALLGTTAGVAELEGSGGHADQSSQVQAVVDWFGPTDLLTVGAKDTRTNLLGGDAQSHPEAARRASPMTYVSRSAAPFLIMHGDEDRTVPISQSESFAAALTQAGAEATFVNVQGAGHGGALFNSEDTRQRVRDFFDRHLKTSAVAAQADDPQASPNFVVINIDDLGYADIGPFGSTLNRTPHLDRMAAEGMMLKCHYAAPVCSPSRSALMTGCYPKRVLPIPGVLFPAARVGLHPQETTVAEVLKQKGYTTACVGKWHLGDQPEFLPTSQGFDYYYGIPYSNDMGTAADGSKSDLGAPLPAPKAAPNLPAPDETGLRGDQQPPLPLLRNQQVIERVGAAEQQTLTQRYTEEAVKFLRTNRDRQFFLYVPHTAVHFPLYPGKAFHGKSQNGLIGDWIEEVDGSVGQILDTLRALQLDRRTLVLFTSDNGGTPRSVNKPLRGFKGSTWEGGMRVPTIAWWPGRIPAGRSTDEVTSMMDILPTLAGLAGASLPESKLDGGDIWPLLSGAAGARSPHEAFYYFRGLKLEAVRQGPWKLVLAPSDNAAGKAPAKKKQAGSQTAVSWPQLYRLDTDVAETSSLTAAEPEVVAQLQGLVQRMQEDLGIDGIGPGCRELGRVDTAEPLISRDGVIRDGFR